MRLFAALEIQATARKRLTEAQTELKVTGAARGVTFIPDERLHLTLVFVGEVAPARGTVLIEAMAVDFEMAPFTIGFGGLGVFPSAARPRTLWIGVREGARETSDLQARVAGRLEALGVPREPRPFSPHSTLGRWSKGAGRARWRTPEDDRIIARTGVEAVTFFESRLSPAGPTYTAVAMARLQCRAS